MTTLEEARRNLTPSPTRDEWERMLAELYMLELELASHLNNSQNYGAAPPWLYDKAICDRINKLAGREICIPAKFAK